MPRENTNPEAILEAIRKIDILSELLEDKQKNNLKMIAEGREANVLETVRPALRLLRSLKKFAEKVDTTYRAHGLANTIGELQEAAGDSLSPIDLVAVGNLAQFMAYGKHHLLVKEGTPIDK